MHRLDRVEQLRHTTSMQRREDHHRCPVDETELITDLLEQALPASTIELIPLVEDNHDAATGIDHVPGQAGILIGDALIGIEQQADHIGLRHRLHRLERAE